MKKVARILLILGLLACAMPISSAFADGVPKCGASSCTLK